MVGARELAMTRGSNLVVLESDSSCWVLKNW